MEKIRFKNGVVEDYTIILSTRDYRHQGQIAGIKSDTIEYAGNLNSANELSFTVCKFDMIQDRNFLSDDEYERYCEEIELLWERIVDFKLIYVKELNEYFEIKVSVEDAAETIKTVTATSLCECELSNLIIDSLEINTSEDIEIQSNEYDGTVFYNEKNPEMSLLHRVIADKAPHYSIKEVDDSLKNEIRVFSVSGTSIYDFLTGDVAEQFNCIFIFDSTNRSISAYDLYTICKDCGHREEYFENDICPNCGKTNIKCFGNDTTIYIDKTNLTDSIRLETNADEVKNCLKLEAGDDLMTSTVQMLNPNGSNYLYRITEFQREDMPESLVDKLDEYDKKCASYAEEHESLVEQFYQLTDDVIYLEHGMMPTIKTIDKFEDVGNPRPGVLYVKDGKTYVHNGTEFVLQNDIDAEFYSNLIPKADAITSGSEAAKLTVDNLTDFGVTSITENTKAETINVPLKNYAKIFVKTGYVKIDIAKEDKDKNPLKNEFFPNKAIDENGNIIDEEGKGIWRGHFIVTNYSDEEDIVITPELQLIVHEDYEKFIKQKVLKDIALNNDDEDGTIFDVLEIDDETKFKNALTLYGVKKLESFYDAIEGALNVLVESEQSTETATLYEEFYLPYYNKLQDCQAELNKRNSELEQKQTDLDTVDSRLNKIHEELDFRTCLGEENYKIFCAYRREDTYSNENYISEGSEENSSKLIADAKLFLKAANQELIRVSEPQITITSSLKNFLVIPQFKPLLDYFELGNWIRVKVDGVLYSKVRLIGYNISFGSLQEIGVQFSSVTKERNVVTDVKEIIQSAKSMSSSFGYVSKQAEKGSSAKDSINDIAQNGLNSGLIQIQNNTNEEITYGKHGILCRSFDDLTGDYSPEQLKITHNIMAYTDDNWRTVSSALGKHMFKKWEDGKWVNNVEGYGLSAQFVTAGHVSGSQIIGGEIVSDNYEPNIKGTRIDLREGGFDFGGGKFTYDSNNNKLILKDTEIEWETTNTPILTVNDISGMKDYLDKLGNLEDQLDSRAQTWYQSTDPSIDWITNEDKTLHIGDLWHYTGETSVVNGVNRVKDSEWIWQEENDMYKWVEIEISDAVFDMIDGKSHIFTSTPMPPYNVGDLWVQGSNDNGDVLHCVKERLPGEDYVSSDWEKSSKYTDDTVANAALAQAQQGIASAAQGITLANAAQTTANEAKAAATSAETNAKNYADTQDGSLKTTLTNAYQTYTNTKISDFDSYVAKYLGLGGNTIIGSNYVISPIIEGGYLNITNTANNSKVIIDPNNLTGNNFIFQVHNGSQVAVGVDSNGNALFNGAITATSLTLGDNVTISSKYIDGLDKYITSDDIPILPENIITADDVSISSTTNENGVITQSITVGNNTYKSIVSGDFILTDVGLGTDTDDGSQKYTRISREGALTAKNAVIYGTVYATNGRFTGTVSGSSIEGGSISIGENFSVDTNGVLNATGANITGSISADDGKIGGFSIYSNTLVSNNKIKIDSGGKIKLVSDSTLTDGNEKYYSTFYVSGGILQISGSSTNTLDNNTGYTTDNKYPRIRIDPWGIDGFTYDSSTSWFTIYNLDKQISIRDTDGEFINHGNSIFIGEAEARSGLHTSSISSDDFIYLKGHGETSDESGYVVKLSYDGDYGYFMPSYTSSSTSYTYLGGNSHKWKTIYATNGTITTSDRNYKRDIELLSKKYTDMFDLLEPVSYKMIDGDRTHAGFIAQDVEKAMDKIGLTSLDFGGLCKDIKTTYDEKTKKNVAVLDENGDYEYSYSLRYNEFIPLNTAKIKQLEQLILQLQEEIKELKS